MSDEVKETGSAAMGHPAGVGWERAAFGSGSIDGTIRMVLYALAFVLVFGTLFAIAQA